MENRLSTPLTIDELTEMGKLCHYPIQTIGKRFTYIWHKKIELNTILESLFKEETLEPGVPLKLNNAGKAFCRSEKIATLFRKVLLHLEELNSLREELFEEYRDISIEPDTANEMSHPSGFLMLYYRDDFIDTRAEIFMLEKIVCRDITAIQKEWMKITYSSISEPQLKIIT